MSNLKHCEEQQKGEHLLFVSKALTLKTAPKICYESVTICSSMQLQVFALLKILSA